MSDPAACTVVLIEDEKPIRRFLTATLVAEGWQVHEAETGARGLVEVATRKPDLIILDLGLPDMDGVSVIRELRGWCDRPVLVLSARTQEAEKVAALDAGADDYLSKPFGTAECLARLRVLLRRHAGSSRDAAPVVRFGTVEVDLVRRLVSKAGVSVHLTPLEYRLLATLIREAGKVLTHRELLRAVWGPAYSESSQYLRVFMGHLRQKLEDEPARPRHILTEIGVGYRLLISDQQ